MKQNGYIIVSHGIASTGTVRLLSTRTFNLYLPINIILTWSARIISFQFFWFATSICPAVSRSVIRYCIGGVSGRVEWKGIQSESPANVDPADDHGD